MIQLTAMSKPTELTEELQEKLTELYKKTAESVWKQKFIERDLLRMSFGKCCYCECNVVEESKYMEIDHFHPKSLYDNEVVKWENLLPSCKLCNGSKGNFDTQKNDFLHPIQDNPQEHLYFLGYRLRVKNSSVKAKNLLENIDLNNKQRLVDKRFEIGEAIEEKLIKLLELTIDYENGDSKHTRRKNIISNSLINLLQEGQPTSDYSALAATVILQNPDYQEIKLLFVSSGLWNEEFNNLEKQLIKSALMV
jgi:uncharacterized protein (TIGR02646 family)